MMSPLISPRSILHHFDPREIQLSLTNTNPLFSVPLSPNSNDYYSGIGAVLSQDTIETLNMLKQNHKPLKRNAGFYDQNKAIKAKFKFDHM